LVRGKFFPKVRIHEDCAARVSCMRAERRWNRCGFIPMR